MLHSPIPYKYEVGSGPLPLEDDNETDDQSTDTQISSNAPHPGYSWVTYRQTFHGTPIALDSMDDHPFHVAYVAYKVDARYGEPSIYATLGEGHPAFIYPLQAKQHAS